jgi:hypothetical protein
MKNRLNNAGLFFMLLGICLAVFYILIYITLFAGDIPRLPPLHDILVVILPAVIVTGFTLADRLFGSLVAALFSVAMLAGCIYSRVSTVDTKADPFWLAITICFLLGSAFVLTSLAIHAPHRIKAKA